MPATVQDWWFLPPCLTWVPVISRPCNRWGFLKDTYFRFRDQDIAAGFYPPHPFKCTRNLFFKRVVLLCGQT